MELMEKYSFSQSCEKLQFKHLDMIMKVYRNTPRENSFVFVVVLEQWTVDKAEYLILSNKIKGSKYGAWEMYILHVE